MGEIVSRNELSNQFLKGVGGVGAGVALLILLPIVGGPVGYIGAGILLLAGLVLSASKTQRKAGAVSLIAGIATGIVALLSTTPIIKDLFWLAPIGLIIAGGISLYRFFKNMKART
jgi:hypothetical protein